MRMLIFIVSLLMITKISFAKDLMFDVNNMAEENCLALNIYFESRGEPLIGQIAVGFVTLNRVTSDNYSNTICEVVFEPKQFSWTKKSRTVINELKAWRLSKITARFLLDNYNNIFDPTDGAIHFHATYIKPYWANNMVRSKKIKNHIFYASR